MKLLIITQKVDSEDPGLGFFHRWILEFSKHSEKTSVICLQKGTSSLPKEIQIMSLGKETFPSRFRYVVNFYRHIFREWKNYDAVLVHMNQEYVLLGGLFWRLFGKRVYMWRNHHAGSLLTDVAAAFCTKVFCTSKFSFTAKYKKTILMPVGVDISTFFPLETVERNNRSILFLARISPSKKPDLFIRALADLLEKNTQATGSIYGDPLPKDIPYYMGLKKQVEDAKLQEKIIFHAGVPNTKTVPVYSAHGIFVNLSSSGMYDKTIFEAMACGCLILASNDNLKGQIHDRFIFEEGNRQELTQKLEVLLNLNDSERASAIAELRSFANKHTLASLGEKLIAAMK